MKQLVVILYLVFFTWLYSSAQQNPVNESISKQTWCLTEVMYHDVVNPPAAARFYAYSMYTGYEILTQLDPSAPAIRKNFHSSFSVKIPVHGPVDKKLAVLYGILETGKGIIPSGYLLEEKQEELIKSWKQNLEPAILNASIQFAKDIAQQVIAWSKTDGYFKLSTRARYTPSSTDSSWRPTPPEYMLAVEPHWRTIRTFFLDTVSQFRPVGPVVFSKDSGSAFMNMVREVYTTTRNISDEQKLIANFWDCNPFAVQFQGHMSIGLKKISPGGHWMGITGIVTEKAGLDFNKSMLLHTLVAMTLHDAFASCWDEKYRSNRIRPETAINRYIDPNWKPLLQTPPFPEYSSGHSVISTAVAELLTSYLGDQFSFTDTVETYIGLPARTFSSFRAAAAEARISRLYGGIHFRDAIENGGEQGRRIAEFIINRLKISFKANYNENTAGSR